MVAPVADKTEILRGLPNNSILKDGDVVVSMGSSNTLIGKVAKYSVEALGMCNFGAMKTPDDLDLAAQSIFEFIKSKGETKKVVFMNAIGHVFNPSKWRDGEKQTLSEETLKFIEKVRGSEAVCELSGKEVSSANFVEESEASDKVGKPLLDKEGNVKKNKKTKQDLQIKPLGDSIAFLQKLVAQGEKEDIAVFLENRDSLNPLEGHGGWARMLLLDTTKLIEMGLMKAGDKPLTKMFDIGGSGTTIVKLDPKSEEVTIGKNFIDADGKETKEKLDANVNSILEKTIESNEIVDVEVEMLCKEMARRLDSFSYGKKDQEAIALCFTGEFRKSDKADEIINTLNAYLEKNGYENAKAAILSNEDEMKYTCKCISKVHHNGVHWNVKTYAKNKFQFGFGNVVKGFDKYEQTKEIQKQLDTLNIVNLFPDAEMDISTHREGIETKKIKFTPAEIAKKVALLIVFIVLAPLTIIALIARAILMKEVNKVIEQDGEIQVWRNVSHINPLIDLDYYA